jgi:Ca2+-binding RTX toxin-like protein
MNRKLNSIQKLKVLTLTIFLFYTLFIQLSFLKILNHSIVYAAVISCDPAGPSLDTCNGTEEDDNMKGDSERNLMYGLGGDDQLSGGADSDGLHGGSGDDQLIGGPGDDILYGSPGEDSFRCGHGNDQIIYFNASEGDTKTNDCERLWP